VIKRAVWGPIWLVVTMFNTFAAFSGDCLSCCNCSRTVGFGRQ
jgi:hypothetical protein